MKIQQMAFMLIAVFILFILAGLFVLQWQLRDIRTSASDLNREATLASLETIAQMQELSCGEKTSLCLDEDKVWIMAQNKGQEEYETFWPVASINLHKVYPSFNKTITCPDTNCNHYEIYNNKQTNKQEYSTYISLCKKNKEQGYINEQCTIAKLIVGVTIQE